MDFIKPGATVLSGIIIAVGASCAARNFQPMFVGEGRFLWNLRHIVELQRAVDDTECELILSNAVSLLLGGEDASTQQQIFTAHRLGREECQALRLALEDYRAGAAAGRVGSIDMGATAWIVVVAALTILVAVGFSFRSLRADMRDLGTQINALKRGRETSGSETGTALSERNGRSG